jgi:hypothetical protein
VGPIWRHAYIMAYFKQVVNCNDTDIVSRIVMTFFKNRDNYNGRNLINPFFLKSVTQISDHRNANVAA